MGTEIGRVGPAERARIGQAGRPARMRPSTGAQTAMIGPLDATARSDRAASTWKQPGCCTDLWIIYLTARSSRRIPSRGAERWRRS
jgi:hypothetical protein